MSADPLRTGEPATEATIDATAAVPTVATTNATSEATTGPDGAIVPVAVPGVDHRYHRHVADVPAGRGSTRYPAAFRDAYVVRELVGRSDGALGDPSVRVGTVELPAGFVYPTHRHPAAEVYVVLAGTLRWEVDGERFAARPGSTVHHPPGAVHAMTVTDDGPAELLWIWHPAAGDPDGVLGVDAEPVGPWPGVDGP